MRTPREQPWTVEISSRAWQQLGVVPGEVFRDIKRGLDDVARLVAAGALTIPVPGSRLNHTLSLTVGKFAALYTMDAQARTVRLEEVTRRLGEELVGAAESDEDDDDERVAT